MRTKPTSKAFLIILSVLAVSTLSACFPKAYTDKEEKDQLAHAIAIARVYQEKYAPSARIKEDTFHVYDSMPDGESKLYLTDWAYGDYTDGGEYQLYINTNTNAVYSDKMWSSVEVYGSKLAEKLYGLDESEMIVDVWGYTHLPFCEDDDAFAELTLSNMLPATDTVDEKYVRDLLAGDKYHFTYHIDVSEDVKMDMFKALDIKPLGKNVNISVRQFSEEAFTDRLNHPQKRSIANKEGMIDEYYSGMEDDAQDENTKDKTDKKRSKKVKKKEGAAKYDGTWYAQDESGDTLTIDDGNIRFESDSIDDEAVVEAKEEDDRIVLATSTDSDIPFWFYEINYYADKDMIEAYTQPMLDDDGGYKRTVFMRDEYDPGDTKMLELLYGDWEIMDDGELIQEPGMKRDRLRFALPQYHRVRFMTAGGDTESFDIELQDLFDDAGRTYDRLILSNRPGSGKYDWDEVRPGQSFQIMIANNLGGDYMMLRELGDERTGFATDGLKYDRSMQGVWMLRRADPNDYDNEFDEMTTTPSTVGIEDEIRQKDTSFYAIKWMEFGNSCTLQYVETEPAGDEDEMLEYYVPDDEYAYSAVNYEYKGQENMAHGGYFDPALVYVTTDGKGRIVEMSKLKYAPDGLYYDTGVMVFTN